MIKKNLFIFCVILALFIPLITSPVSAFFTKQGHSHPILQALDEDPDSAVAKLCGEHPEWLIDGNFVNDAFVLHYTDRDKVQSYIFTHQLNSYYECLREAGSDTEQKCKCYGRGSHIVQDRYAHTDDGLVPKYISKYFSTNLIGHMAVENSMEVKSESIRGGDSISSRLDYYDKVIGDSIMTDPHSIQQLSDTTGLSYEEVERDIITIATGYRGEGFYNTVYKDKVGLNKLPGWFWVIITMLVGIGVLITILFVLVLPAFGVQMTYWRFVIIGLYLIVTFIGVLMIASLYTGDTWQWVRLSLNAYPIVVSDSDVNYYNDMALKATKDFFRNPETSIYLVDDASGLSYRDSSGVWKEGALSKAEGPSKIFFIVTILPFLVILHIFLLYKTFSRKPNKFIKVLGYIILAIIILVVAGDILLILLS